MTPTQRHQRSASAAWATFKRLPVSSEAHSLVAALLDDPILPAKRANRKTRLGAKTLQDLTHATAAIVADILVAASSGWAVHVSTRKEAFPVEGISRTDWADVTEPMIAAGLLDFTKGQWVPRHKHAPEGAAQPHHLAPIMSATKELAAFAASHGIEMETIGKHFQRRKG